MSSACQWKTYLDYNCVRRNVNYLTSSEVKDHPLKTLVIMERVPRRILSSTSSTGRTTPTVSANPSVILEPLTKALEGLDPLTAFAIQEMDPLTKLSQEAENNFNETIVNNKKNEIIPWNLRKSEILSKYTTSEKISIITSFLSEGEKIVVKAQSTSIDKVQHRLEQLDYFEEGSQRKLDLSQSEYVGRIEQLNKELITAWNSEQRVKALKIAIQCAKLLADTDVLSFYPSKFVLITDILETFGQLVYHRLRTKADYYQPGSNVPTALPEDFHPKMVPDSAKETCLNWFYKIASIRELIPRLYVEISLLRCYNFLSLTDCPDALLRLTKVINGVGNPLVAVYARCYLCRIGLNIHNSDCYLIENFNEFLNSYHHLFSRSVKAELLRQKVPQSVYMTLFTPALNYILETVAYNNGDKLLDNLLERCKNQGNSSLILNTIMSAFKPNSISMRATLFLDMIDQSLDQGIPLYLLLRTLGLCVSISPPPSEQKKHLLNNAWKYISNLNETEDYINCVEVWIPFVVQNFSHREINLIIGDIIDHLLPNRNYELFYQKFKYIVEKILSNYQDLELLLSMDNFLPLIDLFQQESVKVEICKRILTNNNYCYNYENNINDPVIINALLFLCSILHDSVNALIPEDEYRQIGDILCGIIRMINYGRDFEQQLNFYVETRGMFSNIDIVQAQLVQCVNTLSVNTRQIIKGLHTQKTSDFVRACAAYCFITIPSIKSVIIRLELYLLTAQVALFNQCLGQAEACFKATLNIIHELHDDKYNSKIEIFFINYCKKFLSILLVVPDNPQCNVLSLSKSLLNILQNFQWESIQSLISIYLNVIDLLSIMAQDTYPYHIYKLESNDLLYGSDPKFITEIDKMCSLIIGEILSHLKQLGPCKKQSQLAMELFCKIISRGDLNNSMITLALNLWNLNSKNGFSDTKLMIKTKNYFKRKRWNTDNSSLQDLIERLNIPN